MSSVEAMLMSQAAALDAMFHTLVYRSAKNAQEGFREASDQYLRLALKAQGNCRATLLTLSEVKNPRTVAFIKQANLANGPQQVNNGTAVPAPAPARAQETSNPANKLLEANPSERLEFGATAAAGGANQELETLGTVHRPEIERGQIRRGA
jgi:hypothetical protein